MVNVLQHALPPSFGMSIRPASQPWACHLVRIVLQAASRRLAGSALARHHDEQGIARRTFSSLPISSFTPPTLLGVLVSIDPSASCPGQSNSRCFPLRRLLYVHEVGDETKRTQVRLPEHTDGCHPKPHHFFPNSLNVEPPTGTAVRGFAMSQTVNVI